MDMTANEAVRRQTQWEEVLACCCVSPEKAKSYLWKSKVFFYRCGFLNRKWSQQKPQNLTSWPGAKQTKIMCLQYAFLPVEAANIDRFFLPGQKMVLFCQQKNGWLPAPAASSTTQSKSVVLDAVRYQNSHFAFGFTVLLYFSFLGGHRAALSSPRTPRAFITQQVNSIFDLEIVVSGWCRFHHFFYFIYSILYLLGCASTCRTSH